MKIEPVVAFLSEDRRTFTLAIGTGPGAWSGTYDIGALAGWLNFYRALRDRRHGQWSAYYERQVAALERVKAELGGTS